MNAVLRKNDFVFVPFRKAIPYLHSGDVVLWRGTLSFSLKSIISLLIMGYTSSKYTHVGVLHRDDDLRLTELIEFRELLGGRTTNLEKAVDRASGRIDVYRPNAVFHRLETDWTDGFKTTPHEEPFDGDAVVREMKKITGDRYSYGGIINIWLRKTLPVKFFIESLPDKSRDITADLKYKVCSTTLASAFHENGFLITANKNPNLIEPGDFARSPNLNYLFTLTKDQGI